MARRSKTAMAAQYTEVTLEEIEKFLKRAFRAFRPHVDKSPSANRSEVAYILELSDHVGIRVFTSVGKNQDTAAGRGADAMRLALMSMHDFGPLQGKIPTSDTVRRTQNWRDNLKARIETMMERYEEKSEFWDDWAEHRNRKKQGPSTKDVQEFEQSEEAARREDDDGSLDEERSTPRIPTPPPPPPVTQPAKSYALQGEITEKQANYIMVLLRKAGAGAWQRLGLGAISGLAQPPHSKFDLEKLSKKQASGLIDALLRSTGGSRYARLVEAALADDE